MAGSLVRTMVAVGASFLVAAAGSATPAAAQGLEFLHAQRAEGGRVCFVDHFHYGSSSGQASRAAAERAAVSDWAGFTAFEYGNRWGSWRLAASKGMSCSQSGGWSCSVQARPCRPR